MYATRKVLKHIVSHKWHDFHLKISPSMHVYIDMLWKYNYSCMKLRHKVTIISINLTNFITISNYGTYIHLNRQCNHVLLKLNQTNSMNMEVTHNNFNNIFFLLLQNLHQSHHCAFIPSTMLITLNLIPSFEKLSNFP